MHQGDARTDPIPGPAGGFDLILANVTAAVQVALAPVIATVAAPGAQVVVSGILADQEAAVRAAHPDATVDDRLERDGWVGLVLRHPGAG